MTPGLPRHVDVPGFAPPKGYANAMVAEGKVVVLAGQIGWNPATGRFEALGFVDQVAAALRNIVSVLRAANAEPRHLVRLTWYITDRDAYLSNLRAIGAAYRDIVGAHYPAMSVVVISALVEPEALVEIEATAVLPPND